MRRGAERPAARRRRRALELGIVLLGVLLTAALVAGVSWPVVNDVTTGETPEYPELRPLALRYSPELVLARAAETVEGLEGWRLVELNEATGIVRAEAVTELFGFVDDVTVRVAPNGTGSLLTVRSRSRVGRADFGQNARNVRRFQGALRANLELARRAP